MAALAALAAAATMEAAAKHMSQCLSKKIFMPAVHKGTQSSFPPIILVAVLVAVLLLVLRFENQLVGSNPGSEIIPFIRQLSEENRQLWGKADN